MIGLANLISDFLILFTSCWGTYWYCQAERRKEAIEYMIEEEAEDE